MSGILCDLYELTMAVSYRRHGVTDRAVFSLYARELPPGRGYLVVGGTDDAVDAICSLGFDDDELAYLRSLGFDRAAVDTLAGIRFTGDVWAMPEGRIVTAQEPILEVTAPIDEGQLVETLALNQVTYQTTIATKAARCRDAAAPGGIELADFAFRHTHGVEAAMAVARLSATVGFGGTSNVAAARAYGLPAVGTMAHSYIEAFPSEREAFATFAADFPDRATFLVDTYDTLAGVDHAIEVIRELGLVDNLAVRLDSGDLADLAVRARARLDAAGLPYVRIFVSGGVDEHLLAELARSGAPVDAAGIGTHMAVAVDSPSIDTVYKLVDYAGRPVRKVSPGKETMPGAKQVWRRAGGAGGGPDTITRRDEVVRGADPLLVEVVHQGERVAHRSTIVAARARFESDLAALPADARRLDDPVPLAAHFSPAVEQLAVEADRYRRSS